MSKEEIIACSCCGSIIEGESYETKEGDIICEHCFENEYIRCSDCGEIVPNDEAETVEGNLVCEDCIESIRYWQCVECGTIFDSRRTGYYILHNGDYICHSCYSLSYVECCECRELYNIDDAVYDDDENSYYCPNCDELRHRKKIIHTYSYKPMYSYKTSRSDVFLTETKIKDLLFGVELEIDKGYDRETTAEEICEASEDVYCKHDGSLSSGVEIVTHPCTLKYHLNELGWDKLTKIALKHKFLSQNANTCGLHIHVGRWQLGKHDNERTETIAKIIILVYRHWHVLLKFSRRSEEKINQWAARPDIKIPLNEIPEDIVYGEEDDGRYKAINVCNDSTIEFRLYNGTLLTNTILASLQMTSNICRYAMTHNIKEVLESNWEEICAVEEYAELTAYLEKRGLKTVTNPPPYGFTEYCIGKNIFGIGDIVKIISVDGDGIKLPQSYIGKTAVVVEANNRENCFGIKFEEEDTMLNTLYRLLPENKGYWVKRENIALA